MLVLGVGNVLLRDEGLGVRVVERLRAMALPDTVEVFDGATAGFDLLDVVADRRKVIVVDAVQTDAPPGTIFRFSPPELDPRPQAAVSLHEVGFLEALRAAHLIGCAPEEVVVLGVKPKEVGCGLDLSDEVTAALPKVIALVIAEATA